MSGAHIRANEVQKTIEPVRQPGRELIRQQEQGPAQAVAPQAAYRRAQLNRNGLRPADLLALQRAVGNRTVQRMVAQRQQLRGIIGGAVQLQGGSKTRSLCKASSRPRSGRRPRKKRSRCRAGSRRRSARGPKRTNCR